MFRAHPFIKSDNLLRAVCVYTFRIFCNAMVGYTHENVGCMVNLNYTMRYVRRERFFFMLFNWHIVGYIRKVQGLWD